MASDTSNREAKSSHISSTPLVSSAEGNNPTETGYDPTSYWSNVFNILSGRMTPRGQDLFREDAYIRNEARDIKKTEEWRDYLFAYSPIIRFLSENIKDLNGSLGPSNVICRRCPTRIVLVDEKDENGEVVKGPGGEVVQREKRVRQGGGFSPDHGIMICANEMRSQGHMEDTLAHEMVHAWDHLRWKVDWADLRHAACTEIRASMLSGECRWTREFFTRNNWTLTQQFQNCVRSRAVRSVMHRPACKDDVHAVKVVNEVWDSCFSDTRPFDEVYK